MSDAGNRTLIDGWKKASDAYGMPTAEMSSAFRALAEKNLSACRENYRQVQAASEHAGAMLRQNYETTSKGIAACQAKAIDVLQTNVASTFDYYNALLRAKTVAEFVEISAAHMRKQCEAFTTQTKELTTLTRDMATESAKAFKNNR